jgi:carboxypeptidase D
VFLIAFYVDGKSIPEVDFDVGPSWSGLLPISSEKNETRKVRTFRVASFVITKITRLKFQLFFWFFPPGPEGSLDDLIFWSGSFHLLSYSFLMAVMAIGQMGVRDARLLKVFYKRMECVSQVFAPCLFLTYHDVKPFQWGYGQAKPTQSEFSWTNLSSVLWVEQPVGTGFSQGIPNIKVCHGSCSQQ